MSSLFRTVIMELLQILRIAIMSTLLGTISCYGNNMRVLSVRKLANIRQLRCLATVDSGGDIDKTNRISQINDRKKRVLSGVQPTGSLHLGNYLGGFICIT